MSMIDKLAWLYLQDKQLLGARSKGKNIYYIPGGKRELGESDQTALCREIKEELSVDLIPSSIKFVGVFTAQAHGKPEDVVVKMSCYMAEFTGQLHAAAEIEETIWLTYQDKAKCSAVTQIILDWLKANDMIN